MIHLKQTEIENCSMKEEICVVRSSLAVVLRISRVVGIAPLNFEHIRNGYKISISRKWAIYGYILITLINITKLLGLFMDFQRRVMKTKTLTSIIFIIPDIITAMLSTGIGIYNSVHRMKKMIRNLTLFDKVKANMNMDSDKKMFRNTIQLIMGIIYLLLIFIYLVIQTSLNAIDYPTEKFIVAAYGIFYTEYIILVILQLQIVFTLLEAHSVLKLMSYKLNGVLSLDKSENELINEEMNRIGCAYVAVCEIISNINNLDGCIAVTIFANFITSFVTTGYYGDLFFTEFSGDFVLIQLSWCCLYAMRVLVFIESFHLINKEVDLINIITSKAILKTTDLGKRCLFNVDIMFKQLLLNKPAYAPMGLFNLNRSLIITIFSAIVTYLLFMIQFKWPETTGQRNN